MAVIFDAYGTLIDTSDGSLRATRTILEKNAVELDPVSFYRRWKQIHRARILGLTSFKTEEEVFLLLWTMSSETGS